MTEQQSGGQVAELAMMLAKQSETLRTLSDRVTRLELAVNAISETIDADPEAEPHTDLAGRPLR